MNTASRKQKRDRIKKHRDRVQHTIYILDSKQNKKAEIENRFPHNLKLKAFAKGGD